LRQVFEEFRLAEPVRARVLGLFPARRFRTEASRCRAIRKWLLTPGNIADLYEERGTTSLLAAQAVEVEGIVISIRSRKGKLEVRVDRQGDAEPL
jgi:hypothetical protein